MINTSIENVVDLASPEIHPLAEKAKDIAAGAVLFCAIISVIVGLLIFLPKISFFLTEWKAFL
jgi:diacylglycerol kinase